VTEEWSGSLDTTEPLPPIPNMPHDPPHEPSSTPTRCPRIDVAFLSDEQFLLATALYREIRALHPGMSRRRACRIAITLAVLGSAALSRPPVGRAGENAGIVNVLSTGA